MRNIVVTGADGNLGKAVVNHFLEKGNQVIGMVHHPSKSQAKERYEEYAVDLTDEEATRVQVKKIVEKYKKIQAVVLTAGGFASGKLGKTGTAELQKQYRLNFLTAFHVVRPVYDFSAKEDSVKLFFIGSEPGMNTAKGVGVVAYSLAKSQLFQLAHILNADTSRPHLKAQVVVPSTIDTPQNRKAVPDADYSKWEKPEDIAKIIDKYCSSGEPLKEIAIVKEELKLL